MKRWLLCLAVLGAVLYQSAALATDDDGQGFSIRAQAGVNLLSFFDVTSADSLSGTNTTTNRVSWEVGGRAAYFFTHFVSIFAGADFTTRGAKLTSGTVSSAGFLDFPVGVLFRWGYDRPVTGEVGVGGYFSLPLGNLTASGVTVANTKFNVGLLCEGRIMFAVGDSKTQIGVVSWLKDAVSTTASFLNSGNDGRAIELGFGVAFSFL